MKIRVTKKTNYSNDSVQFPFKSAEENSVTLDVTDEELEKLKMDRDVEIYIYSRRVQD